MVVLAQVLAAPRLIIRRITAGLRAYLNGCTDLQQQLG